MSAYDLITILGPTASGKTALACRLACELNTEIISGDSRQVYRTMNIGTGKDLADYTVNGRRIPYHLIDVRNAGEKYNIFEYQHDFHRAYSDIKARGLLPVLCGGSGLYIESTLKGYSLANVPENKALRKQLETKSLSALTELLRSYRPLHNTTDVDTAQRAIRAIEIEEYKKSHRLECNEFPPLNSLLVGVHIERDLRRQRITARLKARLDEGMLDEVNAILRSGVSPENLMYYGLEYKYLTLHALGKLSYSDMFSQLETAIHQFAKRQMTWFRGMEKRSLHIHWLDYSMPLEEKCRRIIELINDGTPSAYGDKSGCTEQA
ncbi:MAG: tRNA (adenosine(37)-N6)-dimethylallyltransferase MiaA [Prevotella sp.]|jgi:tRNA dimethylallyltransferase|nr:tRNA (adenosine(37)-N6)-dimethylallyltransferase MiaA [Prevotella sp.]